MSLLTPSIITTLSALYSSPDRHYHNLLHVQTMLTLLHTYRTSFSDPEAVEAAIWFHDAVYDPQAKGHENEMRSAEMAVTLLSGTVDAERVEKVRVMVVATAAHAVPDEVRGCAGLVGDLEMFLDMDMAILGAERGDFERYEDAVRREYAWVGEEGWRKGRAQVLRSFLGRERIYLSDLFLGLYEESARANIEWSLSRLEKNGEVVKRDG
jgi:predicted metal-dependent HD superfamily phosphohydrolase